MASTVRPRGVTDGVDDDVQRTPAHLRPRRSPRLVAMGVLLACLGGLGGAVAFERASHANQVVLVQRTVMRGSTIQPGDLAVVTVGPVPGVHTVPAGRLSSLLGQQALVDLPAGSLVGAEAVGTTSLPPGSAQLGLKLAVGRIPNGALPAGTPVQLVAVANQKQPTDGAQTPEAAVDATVLVAPERLADGASRSLDVVVPAARAAEVADLAAQDRLVVVRRADR